MNDEQKFLQARCDHPADLHLPLIFADFLRMPIIHSQCLLSAANVVFAFKMSLDGIKKPYTRHRVRNAMSRRDRFHNTVVEGLRKDGWTITDDPLTLEFAGSLIGIDLGAEKLVAAEREGNRIAVEIKSFSGFSDIVEFEKALGQYLSYTSCG